MNNKTEQVVKPESGRLFLDAVAVPENLATMTPEELDALAGTVVGTMRDAMRPYMVEPDSVRPPVWHYYLLDPSVPTVYRTDQASLNAKVYQRWSVKRQAWVDAPFPNPVSDDFERGSYGFVPLASSRIAEIIGSDAVT